MPSRSTRLAREVGDVARAEVATAGSLFDSSVARRSSCIFSCSVSCTLKPPPSCSAVGGKRGAAAHGAADGFQTRAHRSRCRCRWRRSFCPGLLPGLLIPTASHRSSSAPRLSPDSRTRRRARANLLTIRRLVRADACLPPALRGFSPAPSHRRPAMPRSAAIERPLLLERALAFAVWMTDRRAARAPSSR